MPEFLPDDFSGEALKNVLARMNSSFIQAMDFRFILAKDGDKVYKIDLNQITKAEAAKNGSLIHTTCGVFVSAQTVEELEAVIRMTVVA